MAFLSPPPLSVYYCYDPTDLAFSRALDVHLGPLKRNGWIQTWDDQQIPAGAEWEMEREKHLHTAHLLILLVSADFLASESGVHMMQVALQRHQIGEAIAIPILVRAANWEETDLQTLQMLPREQKAIAFPDKDDIWREVTREIQRVVEAMRQWIFVAYSPEDQAFVEQLHQDMIPSGVLLWSLEKGQNTRDLGQDETRNAMRAASTVILIASPEAASSRLVKAQLALAEDYRRPILVVWARGEDWRASNPGKWRVHEVIDARDGRYKTARNAVLMRLRQGMTALPPFVRPRPSIEPRNPYKGLKAFTCDDAGDFFGREALIEELATTVETMLNLEEKGSPQIRLLPIIGPSGSGKSSVVMAGLLPYLQSGAIFGSADWVYLNPMFPGTHPLEALAISLAPQFPARSANLLQREDFASDSVRALHMLASQLVQTSQRKIVLVVDQFEELFTLTTSKEEQQQFLDLLITAVTVPRGPVLVVLTLRADFYDRPMQYPELYQLIDKRRISVLRMESEDLRRVIEQPAQLADVQLTFEGNLVGDLLFEMRGQVGALPLLQFTLDQLFERREGHHLTLKAYQEMGGVNGALAKHAEDTYNEKWPSDEHRKMVRDLFLRLLDAGGSEQDSTRRRVALSELEFSEAQQTAIMREVVERFVKARLLTISGSGDNATIEVSHEALIREWDRLTAWLRTARADFALQKALANDTADWIQRGKLTDRLYRGSRLAEMQAWTLRNHPNRDEAAFLQAAEDERKSQEALVIAQKEREAVLQGRVITNQRWLIRGLSVFTIVVVVLASLAGVLYVQAKDAAREANTQAKIARSQALAADAIASFSQNQLDQALLLSRAAYQTYPTYEARNSLFLSLQKSSQLVTMLQAATPYPVLSIAFSPKNSTALVSASFDHIYVWNNANTKTRNSPVIIDPPTVAGDSGYIGGMALSPNGQKLAISSAFGVWLRDTQADSQLVPLDDKEGGQPDGAKRPTPITFSADGKLVLSARCDKYGHIDPTGVPHCTSTKISTYDVATKRLIDGSPIIMANADSAVFRPHSQELATISNANTVQFWDTKTGKLLDEISTGSTETITSLAFSPDGNKLATVSNMSIRLWDVSTRQQLRSSPFTGHTGSITDVTFSSGGSQLAASSMDNTVMVWDVASGKLNTTLTGNQQAKESVAFSSDGNMLASGTDQGTIMLWKPAATSTLSQQIPSTDVLDNVIFTPDDKFVVAGSEGGKIFVYNAQTMALVNVLSTEKYPLLASDNWSIENIALGGGKLVAGRADGTIVLWDIKTWQPLPQSFIYTPHSLYKVMLSADGRVLAAIGSGNRVLLWDVASRNSLPSIPYPRDEAQLPLLDLSPGGMVLAIGQCSTMANGCVPDQIQFWDVFTGKMTRHTSPRSGSAISSIAFSPDRHTLAFSNSDGITLWDVAQDKQELALPFHPDQSQETIEYNNILFSLDGKRLVFYSSPHDTFSFILWDLTLQSPDPLVQVIKEDGFVQGNVAFSSNGLRLASVSVPSSLNNSILTLWDLSIASWQERACSIANRNLTKDEWKQFVKDGSNNSINSCPDIAA